MLRIEFLSSLPVQNKPTQKKSSLGFTSQCVHVQLHLPWKYLSALGNRSALKSLSRSILAPPIRLMSGTRVSLSSRLDEAALVISSTLSVTLADLNARLIVSICKKKMLIYRENK